MPPPPANQNPTQREELMTCATERAVAANLFFSFGTVDDNGEVTLQPHDLRRMLQSMGVVSFMVCPPPRPINPHPSGGGGVEGFPFHAKERGPLLLFLP